jgi:two-component system, LuxR family, response regulator FixJ
MKSLRIAIIDDDTAAQQGLSTLLDAQGHRPVCYSSTEAFRDRDATESFDCILLDLWFKTGMNGMTLLRYLIDTGITTPVIMMSVAGDIESAFNAGELGAVSFLPKPIRAAELDKALLAAVQRRSRAPALALKSETLERFHSLTPAERQVLQLLIEDKPNKIISDMLNLSVRTVESHRARIVKKLGTHSKLAMREIWLALSPDNT